MSDPAKTFPKALAGAVVLVVATYLLPLLMGLGVTLDPAVWKLDDGGYASLAGIVSYGMPFGIEQDSSHKRRLRIAIWADAASMLRPPAPVGVTSNAWDTLRGVAALARTSALLSVPPA